MTLSRKHVCKDIYCMLTKASNPPELDSEWTSKAPDYLNSCIRLFPETDARRSRCEQMDQLTTLFKDGTRTKVPDTHRDGDALLVKFSLLADDASTYAQRCSSYLADLLREFFNSNRHVNADSRREDRFQQIIGNLRPPLTLTLMDAGSLTDFVRTLPEKDRQRAADIRCLAYLISTLRGWDTKTLTRGMEGMVTSGGDKEVALAFDLLHMFTQEAGYENVVLLRLADSCVDALYDKGNYAENVDSVITSHRELISALLPDQQDKRCQYLETFGEYTVAGLRAKQPGTDNATDRGWLADTLISLFSSDNRRLEPLKVMKRVAELPEIDANNWKEKLFQVGTTAKPDEIASEYVYDEWIRAVRRSRTQNEGYPDPAVFEKQRPKEIKILTRESTRFFDEERFESVVRSLADTLDGDKNPASNYAWYMRRLLWLTCICPEKDMRRRLLRDMATYTIINKGDARSYEQHLRACLALLLIPGASSHLSAARRSQAAELLRDLHETDTMASPTAGTNQQAATRNFHTVREVVLPHLEEPAA